MPDKLSRIYPVRRIGNEVIHLGGQSLGTTLLDFWSWSSSDLVSNAKRGVLAEFIVANALGIGLNGVRDEWGAYDLVTPEQVTIKVKSAAYIQSWSQQRLSSIIFHVPKTRGWTADTNVQEKEFRRQAQVYVFALLAHKDKSTIDPLNVNQWCFFTLPAKVLDGRKRSQHSITLKSLRSLAGTPVSFAELREAVYLAAREQSAD